MALFAPASSSYRLKNNRKDGKAMTCINLRGRYGHKYKIAKEESYAADRGETARSEDPWMLTIPCQFGHIFPHGGTMLAVSTNSRGPTSKKLAAHRACRVHQDADDGLTVLFDAKDFSAVAKIIKPRTLRKLSPEHKARLLAASKPFQPGHNATRTAGEGLERDSAA